MQSRREPSAADPLRFVDFSIRAWREGSYAQVIKPMTVLRRFNAALEPTRQAVLDMKA